MTTSTNGTTPHPVTAEPDTATRVSDGQELPRALARLNTELTASNRVVAVKASLNETDLAVLDILHQDGPTAPAALTRRTRIRAATMTNVLARLERDGWIRRVPDAHDRRSARIHPTGTARLTAIYAPANTALNELLSQLDPEHARTVLDFLTRAAETIRQATAQMTTTSASQRKETPTCT